MAATNLTAQYGALDDKEYKRRIRAWTLYDWANSAFATTILAAVLPVYFSSVAGSTLPSSAVASGYWSVALSISLFISAVLSPILGTMSDIMRGKKLFLAIFAGLGILGTGFLILVDTGDWILAAILFIIGRIGFNGSIAFYDALLPHIAKDEDQDRVSSMGYALGYLGGGLLLAVNVAMIQLMPGTWGVRYSFLSVAIWWAVFSIPLFLRVPEPPADTSGTEGQSVMSASFKRMGETFGDLGRYRELFKYLIAFLIYNDGIGTIIGVAAIYATELGFGTLETILALLLVQFVGIPFALMFGRITDPNSKHRGAFFSFIAVNMVLLPLFALAGRYGFLPASVTGAPPPPFESSDTAAGEGIYQANDMPLIVTDGDWEPQVISGETLQPEGLVGFLNDPFAGDPVDQTYFGASDSGARLDFPFNGQKVKLTYSTGPDQGVWTVLLDGEPLLDEDGEPVSIDAQNDVDRYGVSTTIDALEPGEHVLSLVNGDEGAISLYALEVMPPVRAGGFGVIGTIIGMLVALNLLSLAFAFTIGKSLFKGIVESLTTKRGITLALLVYCVVAVWGFFLSSTIEFWFLAWMIAMVQGGSQALSRSLYSSMSPAAKSGEFFGLFSIMEKFASLLGPLVFAGAGLLLRNSRWGVLSLIIFFIVGLIILRTVNVDEGRRVAQEEDQALIGIPVSGD